MRGFADVGPGVHGERRGGHLADGTGAGGALHRGGRRRTEIELVGVVAVALRVGFVAARENAVLKVQRGVDVPAGGARARLHEALLEVVRQEGVEDGVHRRVGVAEAAGQQEDRDGDLGLALVRRREDERHLRDPVGQPAEHVDRDHGQHQFGHLAMRLFLFAALVLWSDGLQLADHQEVEAEDEHQGNGEAQDEAVQGESRLSAQGLRLRPQDVAAVVRVLLHGVGVHEDGHHQQSAGRPRRQGHHFGHERRPDLGRGNRMAHGHVAICAHDRKENAAGELVDAGRRHVQLAHGGAKRPGLQRYGGYQEGDTDQEALVGNGQVDDVHVGDGLHLAEAHHHVDDQRVAQQADDAHHREDDLRHQRQQRLV